MECIEQRLEEGKVVLWLLTLNRLREVLQQNSVHLWQDLLCGVCVHMRSRVSNALKHSVGYLRLVGFVVWKSRVHHWEEHVGVVYASACKLQHSWEYVHESLKCLGVGCVKVLQVKSSTLDQNLVQFRCTFSFLVLWNLPQNMQNVGKFLAPINLLQERSEIVDDELLNLRIVQNGAGLCVSTPSSAQNFVQQERDGFGSQLLVLVVGNVLAECLNGSLGISLQETQEGLSDNGFNLSIWKELTQHVCHLCHILRLVPANLRNTSHSCSTNLSGFLLNKIQK
mmetsp:Transcript_6706/g.25128  ORF Transcript_6706/g.25128 Transcript_6706/m.25128 type:complete len:282 (+) Transcript_6706:631-1476(+)